MNDTNTDNYSYMTPRNAYGSSIITLTNTGDLLFDLELTFRNARQTPTGEIISQGEPLLNEYGINRIIGDLQSIMNRNSMLGN